MGQEQDNAKRSRRHSKGINLGKTSFKLKGLYLQMTKVFKIVYESFKRDLVERYYNLIFIFNEIYYNIYSEF